MRWDTEIEDGSGDASEHAAHPMHVSPTCTASFGTWPGPGAPHGASRPVMETRVSKRRESAQGVAANAGAAVVTWRLLPGQCRLASASYEEGGGRTHGEMLHVFE